MNQLDLLLSLLAFALGFCLSRVSLCAVAAAKSLVLQRHGAAMAALAVAASASGVALLVLNRLWPMQVVLPLDMRVSDRMIIGGILLGAGALINGGCYLGSVSYLGTGNVNFLFTLLGIGLSTRWIGPAAAPMSGMGHALHWLPATIALAAFLAVLCSAMMTATVATKGRWLPLRGPWPWPLAAAACGVVAALLFARAPDWTYGQAIQALTWADLQPLAWRHEVPAVATFLGVSAGALLYGQFQFVKIAPLRALRCLLGGALMAVGANRIPGGNDVLLLWSIPGLAVYGFVTYLVMLATLVAAFWAGRRLLT